MSSNNRQSKGGQRKGGAPRRRTTDAHQAEVEGTKAPDTSAAEIGFRRIGYIIGFGLLAALIIVILNRPAAAGGGEDAEDVGGTPVQTSLSFGDRLTMAMNFAKSGDASKIAGVYDEKYRVVSAQLAEQQEQLLADAMVVQVERDRVDAVLQCIALIDAPVEEEEVDEGED